MTTTNSVTPTTRKLRVPVWVIVALAVTGQVVLVMNTAIMTVAFPDRRVAHDGVGGLADVPGRVFGSRGAWGRARHRDAGGKEHAVPRQPRLGAGHARH